MNPSKKPDTPQGGAFHVTVFPTLFAETMQPREDASFRAFAESLQHPKAYPDKASMPLLCPMEFDGSKSERGALRHNGGVTLIYGACGDHDAGTMSIEDAAERMKAAGIECVLYTTPNYTQEAPRWRVIVAFSAPTKDRTAHLAAVERMNHVLDGQLKTESFTLSQSFYFGRVTGRKYICLYVKGKRIDRLVNIPRRANVAAAMKGKTSAGGGGGGDTGALIATIMAGIDMHPAMNLLAARWLAEGRDPNKVLGELCELGARSGRDGERLARWEAEVVRSIEGAIGKGYSTRLHLKPDNVVALPQRPQEPRAPDAGETPEVVRILRDWKPLDPSTVKPVTFYVEGLIEERRSVGLVAPGGTGKTSMLMDLAIATALGRDWMGMRVKQGSFVLLSLDDLQEDLDGAFMEFMHATGCSETEQMMVRNHVKLISLVEMVEMVAFAMETREGSVIATALANDIIAGLMPTTDLRCVVFDTMRHFAGGDTNSSRVMTILTKALTNIGAMLHCATIGPHHMTKAGARAGDVDQYIGSGSAAFGDNLRVILSLRTATVDELCDSISIDKGDKEVLKAYQLLRLDDTRGSLRRKTLPTIWVKRDGYRLTRVDGRVMNKFEREQVMIERVIEAVKSGAGNKDAVRFRLGIAKSASDALVDGLIANGKLLKANKTSPMRVA